jgi:hypothetical protein
MGSSRIAWPTTAHRTPSPALQAERGLAARLIRVLLHNVNSSDLSA